ncbi:OmpA family protein [Pseudooceanicola algae]|uniref:Peptidoglycan-associated lipoprotein n=1 Tax=Pseudooceanicola algae TaxID=1537215 RepID=A0A418SGJ6_9RHOB|nr:OmpA family protein [Pseudooceanicola algae]QPM91793.1 Peptidoglycan-associated lipoprotein [Pseudooceanicola algae]
MTSPDPTCPTRPAKAPKPSQRLALRAIAGLALTFGMVIGTAPHLDAAPLALSLPAGAVPQASAVDYASFALPLGPFSEGTLPVKVVEGEVSRQSWRLPGQSRTTLQVFAPLRDQLVAAGFTPQLDCETDACGGFDFRFGAEILQPPDMYVDLFDFRAFSGQRDGAGDGETSGGEQVFLVVSRSAAAGFVQLIHVTPEATDDEQGLDVTIAAPDLPRADNLPDTTTDGLPIAAQLLRRGHAVLAGLAFTTGASDLADAPYASLTALADFLADNPAATVALVGHTDNLGALDGNIALSRLRAQSVRNRLIEEYGVAGDRLSMRGIGYLAPITSNRSPEGREANRRVEAVLVTDP